MVSALEAPETTAAMLSSNGTQTSSMCGVEAIYQFARAFNYHTAVNIQYNILGVCVFVFFQWQQLYTRQRPIGPDTPFAFAKGYREGRLRNSEEPKIH